MHDCRVPDAPGGRTGCVCATARDHDQDEMDLPPGTLTRSEFAHYEKNQDGPFVQPEHGAAYMRKLLEG